MSFSLKVKNEIYSNKPKCFTQISAEMYGLLLFSKNFFSEKFVFSSKSRQIINFAADYLTQYLSVPVKIETSLHYNKGSNIILSLVDQSDIDNIYRFFYNERYSENVYINFNNLKSEEEISSFLSGVFLVCGSVINPQKEYRLEFSVQNPKLVDDLLCLISNLPINILPKCVKKKDKFSIYIKESQQVFDFLAFIGAPNSAMELIQVKMVKEVRNYVNRTTNFQTANLSKTANAALIQIKAIDTIEKEKGIDLLPDELKEIAILRKKNPDMSLSELGKALSSPLSRSGVNHRLRKIIDISESLKKEVD